MTSPSLVVLDRQIETKLNEYGIFHYWQVAAMNDADVAALDADLKLNGRATRDGWLETARALLVA